MDIADVESQTLAGFLRNNRRNLDRSKLFKKRETSWSAGGLAFKLAQHCIKSSGQTVRIHGAVEHDVHLYAHPIKYSNVHRL